MNKSWGTIYFGVILVLLGIGFLAQNFGLFIVGDFLGTWWPTYVFVAWGVLTILNHRSRAGMYFGGFLILLGSLWQLDQLSIIPSFSGLIWPLVVIFLGAMILLRTINPPKKFKGMSWGNDTVFGQMTHDFSNKDFKGITTSTVLGETVVDIRKANIVGDKVEIETSTVLAETRVYLPQGMRIVKKLDVIMGEIEDHTHNTSESGKTVEFTGSIVLGSLEIHN